MLFVIMAFVAIGRAVYMVDPYFHYHAPDTERYFYILDNERSMNNGISRYFEYDALITGTSMVQNFMVSEMNELFGVNAVKVPFAGGTYKEINDNLSVALENNEDLRIVVRGLDMDMFSFMEDSGELPTYLYDDNPVNDVQYLLNRDVVFNRVYQMYLDRGEEDFVPGTTSFDIYSNWQELQDFGINSVFPDGIEYAGADGAVYLTEDEKSVILENITQNVTLLADKYPDVEFYYFFTPYSIAWWMDLAAWGTIYRQIESEQYVIELMLEHENIHLYSFNNRTDITTDLNNYANPVHYGQWINSMILKWMHDGDYLLTKDNYLDYLAEELAFYSTFDYNSLDSQPDYESDLLAGLMLYQGLTGTLPVNLLEDDEIDMNLSGAVLVEDTEDGSSVIQCTGSLPREDLGEEDLISYMINESYIGARIEIDEIGDYQYLVFDGKKEADHGEPTVYVYDDMGEVLSDLTLKYSKIDRKWHQYVLYIPNIKGSATIIFNGGYTDNTGYADSEYLFKNIMLY